MDSEAYRAELLAYAESRGFRKPTRDGDNWVFGIGDCHSAVIEYEPRAVPLINYFRRSKGLLTSAWKRANGVEPRPTYSPSHPRRMRPSTNIWDDFLFANSEDDEDGVPDAGKWMLFIDVDHVDDVWDTIKGAVLARNLWHAKVSTILQSPRDIHLICVYTRNWKDKSDVFQCREMLRDLGFEKVLYYKSNEMTRTGRNGSIYRG